MWQPAQTLELGLVGGQLRCSGQFAMDQQVSDFLEFGPLGEFQNVVAAIMQIVAGLADSAQSGVARGNARKRNRFFGFEGSFGVHAA